MLMPSDSGSTTSVWLRHAVPEHPALAEDTRCDVCVIGGGIAGLTTAYLLALEGRRVVVLEDGAIGSGETGRTTAHLTWALDDRYFRLEKLFGTEGALLAAESHRAAVDRIEAIVRDEDISCDFERVDGYLFVPPGESIEILEQEHEAAARAGLDNLRILARAPLTTFDTGPCLHFPAQAQFHPLKYLSSLAQRFEQRGGRIYGNTHATGMAGGSRGIVNTREGPTVTTDAIVVATNTPVNDKLVIHAKQAPYRTYAIAVPVPRGAVPKGLYWDTPDPYHYARVARGPNEARDLLIVGGEDHKTGQADDADVRYRRLEQWTRERFPVLGAPQYRWSGQIMEPVDGMAFIGRNPLDADNVYVATGDSGNGMTHGTIAGLLLTDLIMGRANPWADLYEPSRKTTRATLDFARENLNVAGQYTDLITRGEVDALEEIPRGTGAIMRRGLGKIAVFRDADNGIHAFSALCPHLGCVVRWNHAEATWDCPCHGSRFTAYGEVVNGPANRDLEPAEREAIHAEP
jgi:glycine/D-amino acid oxidase-like deaminating enzyme/nitrite reductase/ring-hydroxylating ferredoxin subunit